jgi:hypothetical protein
MQIAYGNLQLLAAALNGSINSSDNPLSTAISSSNAGIKKSVDAIKEQILALRDILGGTIRGYVCLDAFPNRLFQDGKLAALREEILASIEKVPVHSATDFCARQFSGVMV